MPFLFDRCVVLHGENWQLRLYDSPDLLIFLHDIRDRPSGHNTLTDREHISKYSPLDLSVAHDDHRSTYERIYIRVARHVMLLDMLKFRRVLECRHIPVQISEPAVDGRISATDVANVALEVLDVDCVEADDGHEEADVCFGKLGTEVEGSGCCGGREVGFGLVEVCEQ